MARITALAVLGTLEMGGTVKVGLVSFMPFNLLGQLFNRLGLTVAGLAAITNHFVALSCPFHQNSDN